MPNIASRIVPTYESDVVATDFTNVGFKIKAEYDDYFVTAGLLSSPPPEFQPCPSSSRMKMRHLVVTFDTGEVIKHPIPTRALVNTSIALLANRPEVICIDYIGERWITVPGYGTAGTSYTIPAGRSDKLSGVITYNSDLFPDDTMDAKVAIEVEPTAMRDTAVSCAETIAPIRENAICSTTLKGFRTRRIKLIARNSGTNGKIVRSAPVAQYDSVNQCLIQGALVAICVGYEGEVVKNAHEYFL